MVSRRFFPPTNAITTPHATFTWPPFMLSFSEAWWSEILSGTDGYQHLVRADEVLFTQALPWWPWGPFWIHC